MSKEPLEDPPALQISSYFSTFSLQMDCSVSPYMGTMVLPLTFLSSPSCYCRMFSITELAAVCANRGTENTFILSEALHKHLHMHRDFSLRQCK